MQIFLGFVFGFLFITIACLHEHFFIEKKVLKTVFWGSIQHLLTLSIGWYAFAKKDFNFLASNFVGYVLGLYIISLARYYKWLK